MIRTVIVYLKSFFKYIFGNANEPTLEPAIPSPKGSLFDI